jgi:hypothetical protein
MNPKGDMYRIESGGLIQCWCHDSHRRKSNSRRPCSVHSPNHSKSWNKHWKCRMSVVYKYPKTANVLSA